MISKELLSEVLQSSKYLTIKRTGNIVDILDIDEENSLNYSLEKQIFLGGRNKNVVHRINVHELAHRCKEWALRMGFSIETKLSGVEIIRQSTGVIEAVIQNMSQHDSFIPYDPFYDIKACQWILDNKDET